MKLSNKGFTLPELLLTITILGITLASVIVFFINCVYLNEVNRNSLIAVSHAQFVMEDIRNTALSSVQTNIENGYWDWNTETINPKGLTALRNESIDTQVGGAAELLDVKVIVNWQDRSGRTRSADLETLIGGS